MKRRLFDIAIGLAMVAAVVVGAFSLCALQRGDVQPAYQLVTITP